MPDLTPETLAGLQRLLDAANAERVMGTSLEMAYSLMRKSTRALFIAAVDALPALLDAAALLDEVRGQVARGALCPMCSTGMTRQTVGMVCQLCGTDYARPEYASLRRDAEQTTKAALAEALAVRAERDALAAFAQGDAVDLPTTARALDGES
jgi:hypothetical protein